MDREKVDIDFRKYPFVYNGEALVSLAKRKDKIRFFVFNCPKDYVPLVLYLGHDVDFASVRDTTLGSMEFFPVDFVVETSREALKEEGKLRDLVEIFANSSPRVADILYRIDHMGVTKDKRIAGRKKINFSSWASYGRSYIRDISKEMANFVDDKEKCLILPCAGRRPYNESKIHKEIYPGVEDLESFGKVVVTSLGVIPEKFWNHSVVLSYNAGVPEVWRLYQLCKVYFTKNNYKEYRNFIEFEPYLEVLKLCGIEAPSERKSREYVA